MRCGGRAGDKALHCSPLSQHPPLGLGPPGSPGFSPQVLSSTAHPSIGSLRCGWILWEEGSRAAVSTRGGHQVATVALQLLEFRRPIGCPRARGFCRGSNGGKQWALQLQSTPQVEGKRHRVWPIYLTPVAFPTWRLRPTPGQRLPSIRQSGTWGLLPQGVSGLPSFGFPARLSLWPGVVISVRRSNRALSCLPLLLRPVGLSLSSRWHWLCSCGPSSCSPVPVGFRLLRNYRGSRAIC